MALNTLKALSGSLQDGRLSELDHHWWHGTDVQIPFSKLFYILEGEIIIEIGGERTVGKAGDMLLIPAGTCHSYYLPDHGFAKKYWCHFTLESDGTDYFSLCRPPLRVTVGDQAQVREWFEEMFRCAESEIPSENLGTVSALFRLVMFFLGQERGLTLSGGEDEIDRICRYLREHPEREETLRALSESVHLSPNYLIRKFRIRTGMSPIRYRNRARVEEAKKLLEMTDLPIEEIMARVGFDDPAYFSRFFKSCTSYSPRTWRLLIQKAPC